MDDSETAGIPEHQGKTEDLDVKLARAILDRERELLAEGISADESARLADEYGESSLRRVASLGLPELRFDLSDRVSGLEEMTSEYLTTLSRHWASALDQYRLAAECCKLVGIRLWKHADEEDLGLERLDLQSALAGTWARSVRTGVEVDVLLRAGLPRGAAARARTMHELAVTAFVMSEYGVLDDHVGLGSRYVAYGAVKVWRDAEEYQKGTLRLGTEPLTDDEMARYRSEYDEAVSAYPRLDAQRVGCAASRLSTRVIRGARTNGRPRPLQAVLLMVQPRSAQQREGGPTQHGHQPRRTGLPSRPSDGRPR